MLLALLLLSSGLACQPKSIEMDEQVWNNFLRSVDFQREYAMRREAKDIPYLVRALDEERPLVRYNAAQDLLRMGVEAEPAVPSLITCAYQTQERIAAICKQAVDGFTPIPDNAIPSLLQRIVGPFDPKTQSARQWIHRIDLGDVGYDSEVALAIREGLASNVLLRKAEAARLIGLKGLDDDSARLLELERYSNNDVTIGALLGLYYLRGSLSDDQKTRLEQLGKHGAGVFHPEIAQALGKAIPAISVAHQTGAIRVREEDTVAPKALPETASDAPNSERNSLIQKDPMLPVRVSQTVVRDISRRRLSRREPEKIEDWKRQLPLLRKSIRQGSEKEQISALRVVGAMADYLEEAIPLLLSALASPNVEVRSLAAVLLGEHRVLEAQEPILALLSEKRMEKVAATALMRIGTSEAVLAAAPYLSQTMRAEFDADNATVLRGGENVSSAEAEQECRKALGTRGFRSETLESLVRRCTKASGGL